MQTYIRSLKYRRRRFLIKCWVKKKSSAECEGIQAIVRVQYPSVVILLSLRTHSHSKNKTIYFHQGHCQPCQYKARTQEELQSFHSKHLLLMVINRATSDPRFLQCWQGSKTPSAVVPTNSKGVRKENCWVRVRRAM